jgi:CIC family chloride channel protein
MKVRSQLGVWLVERRSALLPVMFTQDGPLDLRILGRAVLQAIAVGVACGLIGALFLSLLDLTQHVLLETATGYIPLRAHGELSQAPAATRVFRPWLLVFLPALGGLASGLLTRAAPEARGGGGNVMIRAFHESGGQIPRRLIPLKMLASILTLGTGGAGGREGPTMLIGGAVGSFVGRVLPIGSRERRVLMLAGVAAGISAVFRTPLGAALLAVEILYRDGFESDALIPAVLASVVSYSVVISIHGQTTLFGHGGSFPFVPMHLPLYALLALFVAVLAIAFLGVMARVRRTVKRLPVPAWAHPALGGLALGMLIVPILMVAGRYIGREGQGLGMLGGGYGAVQLAISGAHWLPGGWGTVALLAALSLTKLLAASLTIGSGGSAGDFAPSLAVGGLLGGAFGGAAQLLFQDPRIDPGAFALVGMGAFYGGVAHVPLSALVLVCEMAGNYDLLVPLMLALGIASVALRKHSLYEAQVPTQADSPIYRASRAPAAP